MAMTAATTKRSLRRQMPCMIPAPLLVCKPLQLLPRRAKPCPHPPREDAHKTQTPSSALFQTSLGLALPRASRCHQPQARLRHPHQRPHHVVRMANVFPPRSDLFAVALVHVVCLLVLLTCVCVGWMGAFVFLAHSKIPRLFLSCV